MSVSAYTQGVSSDRISLRSVRLASAETDMITLEGKYGPVVIAFGTFIEALHDAVLVLDPDEEVVLAVNERATEMYGIPRQEFIGLSLRSISKDIGWGMTNLGKTLREKQHHMFETVQYRASREEMLLEDNASVIEYARRPALLRINRDLTEPAPLLQRINPAPADA